MDMQQSVERRWRLALEAGELDVWDLRPELEVVQHTPQWKERLGFPEPGGADSTHFWRCRVHPDDLQAMLEALRAHVKGECPHYEARLRLRSNGSGYRLLHSRGRVIERDAGGRVLRIVGTMIDLTDRPPSPRTGLAEGTRGAMEVPSLDMPAHELLLMPAGAAAGAARLRLLDAIDDLLRASLEQLQGQAAWAQ